MKRKKYLAGSLAGLTLILVLGVFVAGCGSTGAGGTGQPGSSPAGGEAKQEPGGGEKGSEPGTLVIYSGRKEPLVMPVVEVFEKATGTRVVVRSGGASELANAIMEESRNARADVFIANDAGTLEKLRREGLLQPHLSAAVREVPADLRAEDGSWTGVSARVRVIMYNTQAVGGSDLPRSVFDLTDPRWRDQVALAMSANESLIGHITAIRIVKGDRAAEDFMRGLMANNARSLKGHTEVRQAVGKGEFALGLVNHYYYHLQKAEGSPVGVIYPDQGPGEMGAAVNVAGVGIIKGARNPAAARAFVDFLISPPAQEMFARLNFEIPVLPGVPVHEAQPLGSFRRAPVRLEQLGQELEATMDLIEKVGLP